MQKVFLGAALGLAAMFVLQAYLKNNPLPATLAPYGQFGWIVPAAAAGVAFGIPGAIGAAGAELGYSLYQLGKVG